MSFSLVDLLDGGDSCSGDSYLGYWGLILWVSLCIYIFIGLYVLCEHYFVPSLEILGDKLGLSEDVCGATLMAAGSSSPELFTALIGAFLYPDENPGPSTNCASAVFNMCVIVGLSIIMSHMSQAQLHQFPFLRDSIFYAISALSLFIFYEVLTPGKLDFGESLFLVLIWIFYVIILYNNEKVKKIMNKIDDKCNNVCGNVCDKLVRKDKDIENEKITQNIPNIELAIDEKTNKNKNKNKTNKTERKNKEKVKNYRKKIAKSTDKGNESLTNLLETSEDVSNIDSKETQEETQTHAGMLAPLPENLSNGTNEITNDANDTNEANTTVTVENDENKVYSSENDSDDNALNANMSENDENNSDSETEMNIDNNERSHPNSKCLNWHRCLEIAIIPFQFIFKLTNPDPNIIQLQMQNDASNASNASIGSNSSIVANKCTASNCKLLLSFIISIVWLGFLTFLVVDLSNKIGYCLNLTSDVMGLTLLAIGSSLPDTFSSILVAREGKLDMAVSNALGSNVFDICVCVGLPFLLRTAMVTRESIEVGTNVQFKWFIIVLFLLLIVFVGLLCFEKLVIKKLHGYVMLVAYTVFIIIFSVVLDSE